MSDEIRHIVREGNRHSKVNMTVLGPHECEFMKNMFAGFCVEKKQIVHYYRDNIVEVQKNGVKVWPQEPCK